MGERMTLDQPAPLWWGHDARYRLAAGYLRPGDRVIDAACGIGYGSLLLNAHHDVDYLGVDKHHVTEPAFLAAGRYVEADLGEWEPDQRADVTVTFETVEHLEDPEAFCARVAAWTTRYILASVPVIPTKHKNPYHLHDFEPGQILDWFPGWRCIQTFGQPSEHSEVYILQPR